MQYCSTRQNAVGASAAQAILQGISADGGLFVPKTIPKLTQADFRALCDMAYPARASYVLGKFLTDFTQEELSDCVNRAYVGTFSQDKPAPLRYLGDKQYVLELWHGPTCAFKDLALQILPHLLTKSAEKLGARQEIVILVATSGDTGKAALEGFRDVDRTKIIVFYPRDGVSQMQKRQMETQAGDNVYVCAVEGNFDDAQSGVKRIFTDPAAGQRLARANKVFSSANSINWGRLVPQIVYYVSCYCDLIACGADCADGFTVCVPTGNFGNILAAYFAREMGVPITKLICASNANHILTDFLQTGVYDRNRAFYTTLSPSMDILISSNLERLLYLLSGCDDRQTAAWQAQLDKEGRYEVGQAMLARLQDIFYAGFCDDGGTKKAIKRVFERNGYLCDPHTAVAMHVAEAYRTQAEDRRPCVVVSTASPYKFSKGVIDAVAPSVLKEETDEFQQLAVLSRLTHTEIPAPILELKEKAIRFTDCCRKDGMAERIYAFLNLQA